MDLEPLRPWNPHWHGGEITPRVLKHPIPRAAVPKWVEEILSPEHDEWLLRPGPRQIGKTTSLGHVAKRLVQHEDIDARQVVLAPADDPTLQEASQGSLETIITAASTQHAPTQDKPLFLLLDEVQELPDWAKQLKPAWDKHHATIRVLATGSSALRVLRPANADFHGRIRTVTIHPMKLREVLTAHPDAPERLPQALLDDLEGHIKTTREALQTGHEAVGEALEALHGFLHAHDLDAWIRQIWSEYLAWGGYPATRPGCELSPIERLERFGSALDTVLARDVSQGGTRKLREFKLLFRALARNPGGKFQPYTHSSDLGVDGETIASWKQILEDTMLIQQLPPFKPNLTPDRGLDKAYPIDPGWVSYFHGHTETIPNQDTIGLVAENVLVDHVRRLQFNIAGNTQLPIGYVKDPEIDIVTNLGSRWLLIEAKYRAQPAATFGDAGEPDAVRIIATRDQFQLDQAPGPHHIPAHELALAC